MDPFSISVGVTSLIDIIFKTTIGINSFIKKVHEAKSEINQLRVRLAQLEGILRHIQIKADAENEISTPLKEMIYPVINACMETMSGIEPIWDECNGRFGSGRWAFNLRTKIQEASESLDAQISILQLALNGMTSALVKTTYSTVQEMNSGFTDLKNSTDLILMQVVENGRMLTENNYGNSKNHYHLTPTKKEFEVASIVDSGCFSTPRSEYNEPDELEFPNGITGFLSSGSPTDGIGGPIDSPIRAAPSLYIPPSNMAASQSQNPTQKMAGIKTKQRDSEQQKICSIFEDAVRSIAIQSRPTLVPPKVTPQGKLAQLTKNQETIRKFKLMIKQSREKGSLP